jgi:hypothetical protein
MPAAGSSVSLDFLSSVLLPADQLCALAVRERRSLPQSFRTIMATIAPNFHESYSTPENEGIRARVDDVADSIFSFMINALHGPGALRRDAGVQPSAPESCLKVFH